MRRATQTARQLFAIGDGKLAIGRGVRTAFALLIPVIAGDILSQPLFAWAALGGWLGSLADKGGSYRTRAATMSAFAILGFACAYAGTEATRIVWLAGSRTPRRRCSDSSRKTRQIRTASRPP